ncbi:TonB-dependent receptor [Brevundimonas nasdae]
MSNMVGKRMSSGRSRSLKHGVSVLVLGAFAAVAAPSLAMAQQAAATDQDDAAEVGEVLVTGTRRALQTSQEARRNADTVVDTITATDIGAFPDKSVAEALQRVPGVTVNRFTATDDASHYGAEPSGVIVRGLSQVRSEYNGRDSFSANSSRGLSWGDISPELMQGVDTYKNQTAELIEGGIAGTINLRTRTPFDSSGRLLQVSGTVNYGDLSQKYTPEVSGIYSDRWETQYGQFGFLVNLAHSEVTTQSEVIQYGRMGIFDNVFGPGRKYIPSSVSNRQTEYKRQRDGIALAGQWRSNDGQFELTGQYNRSEYTNEWRERGIVSLGADMWAVPVDFVYTPGGARSPHIPTPGLNGAPFTFGADGLFQNGTLLLQQVDTGYWGADNAASMNIARNSAGQPMLNVCYWYTGCENSFKAGELNAVTRFNRQENMTQDLALNLKWRISDKLHASFDAQYVDSTVKAYDIEVAQYSFANLTLDASGSRPKISFSAPTNINQSPGGLTNPNNYRYNHVMDHIEDDEGHELALRADVRYDFDNPWFNAISAGVRYADRNQTVRFSGFNWGNIANTYNFWEEQYRFWNIDKHAPDGNFKGYPTGLYETRQFGNSFLGSNGEYVFFNLDRLAEGAANQLSYANLGAGQDQWAPICERTGRVDGCFRAEELNKVQEESYAAYAMLRFGGPEALIGGVPVSGNIGVRYVETKNSSTGSIAYPIAFTTGDLECRDIVPVPGVPSVPKTIGCYLSPEEIAFNSGGGTASTANATHRNWLPSFNLKIDVAPQWVVRFAASRAMSRPDIGLMKNYVSLGRSLPGSDPTDPRWIKNSAGVITGVNPTYQASAYNPYLKPITADQFDLAIEHYFANAGSFTATAFYKKFDNYIQYGGYTLDVTNNGVTRSVDFRGPMNGAGAKVAGFEFAYQQFFDFLPGPWAGLGIQANYTWIDNSGVTNTNVKSVTGGSDGTTAQPGSGGTVLGVDRLEGLSEHQYNLVGMYERGPWAARLAYNWRSDYLVNAVDCCVFLPIWQDDTGFLDGSIRYNLNDRLEISLQGSNLLSTETKLFQQVTDAAQGGTLMPNAWLRSDRRFVLGVRFRY